MLFSSISFIYYFLPVMLLLYFITPRKYKNLTLLLGSLSFYFAGEPKYTVLLLFSTIVDYSHSKIIVKHRHTKKAKAALISSIVLNLSMLAFFKYSDFFISNINMLIGSQIQLLNLKLPIGISFFTFQTMSYTIDVYREEAEVQHNIIGLGAYVSLFPQLIAGPIVRYKTISKELESRIHSFDNFSYGVHRFVIGLSKKVLIANPLGELSQMVYVTPEPSVLFYWMSIIAYALQIYYDFSGYSDMAIGLGRIFGFHFLENFNYPYISKSISEFWQRWHISLGAWFKDYLYIPLGGNRVKPLKWIRNILIVWFLTGLWHGASWNFVIWGVTFGILMVIEKFYLLKILRKCPKSVAHFYTLAIVVLSFVMFKHDQMSGVVSFFKGLMGVNIPLVSNASLYYLRSFSGVILIAVIGATPIVKNSVLKLKKQQTLSKVIDTIEPLVYIGLLLFITGYLVDASFNPFLYFRF